MAGVWAVVWAAEGGVAAATGEAERVGVATAEEALAEAAREEEARVGAASEVERGEAVTVVGGGEGGGGAGHAVSGRGESRLVISFAVHAGDGRRLRLTLLTCPLLRRLALGTLRLGPLLHLSRRRRRRRIDRPAPTLLGRLRRFKRGPLLSLGHLCRLGLACRAFLLSPLLLGRGQRRPRSACLRRTCLRRHRRLHRLLRGCLRNCRLARIRLVDGLVKVLDALGRDRVFKGRELVVGVGVDLVNLEVADDTDANL